jgi:hypothetical protein
MGQQGAVALQQYHCSTSQSVMGVPVSRLKALLSCYGDTGSGTSCDSQCLPDVFTEEVDLICQCCNERVLRQKACLLGNVMVCSTSTVSITTSCTEQWIQAAE